MHIASFNLFLNLGVFYYILDRKLFGHCTLSGHNFYGENYIPMEGHQKLGGTIPLAPLVPTPMLLYTEEFYAHLHTKDTSQFLMFSASLMNCQIKTHV